jgi:hypothetical protein
MSRVCVIARARVFRCKGGEMPNIVPEISGEAVTVCNASQPSNPHEICPNFLAECPQNLWV